MKALCVVSDTLDSGYPSTLYKTEINGTEINYGLIEVPEPTFDSSRFPDSVLIEKKAFSCNYRDMAYVLYSAGKLSGFKDQQIRYVIIGSEFSGVVQSIGDNVKDLSVGDRVIANSEYPFTSDEKVAPGLPSNHASAQFEILPSKKLIRIPDELSETTAAAFSIGAQTTYSMIDKLDIERNKKILITGATSNTSLFAINALSGKNQNLFGLVRNRKHAAELCGLGLQEVFVQDSTDTQLLNVAGLRKNIESAGKFDYIIDPFADTNLINVLDVMNVNAKYITCGISNQFNINRLELNINEAMSKIIMNNLSIFGNCLGQTRHLQNALNDYAGGKLKVIIDSVVREDIKTFFEKTFITSDRFGKIVFAY